MKLVKVTCPQCGGTVEVDENFETAKCPFCKSSFVIEEFRHTRKHKEKAEEAWVTEVIDVEPHAVKNELDMYSLFGWDFKHRKTHKVYDGQRYFKNGNSRDKYKDVVQLTFQRNVKAPWCTEELLLKEKEFFKLRNDYIEDSNKNDNDSLGLGRLLRRAHFETKYKVAISISALGCALLFLIFVIAGIVNDNLALSLVALFLFLPAGIVLSVVFTKLGNKDKARRQKAQDDADKKRMDEYHARQADRLTRMDEIAKWAGEQMEAKFGYKIAPSFSELSEGE